MSIYNHTAGDRTPYFYIIQEVSTGKKYAGCRYAKGCYPEEFMRLDGYLTSSNTIKSIISISGIDAFIVLRIMPESVCGLPVLEYETRFLRDFDIASRPDWYNCHNNDTSFSYYSQQYKDVMIKTYGVVSPMHSPVILEKFKQTNIKKYESEYFLGTDLWALKNKNTLMSRYGVEHNSQIIGMSERKTRTYKEKTGYDYPMQNPEIKKKFAINFKARPEEEKQKSQEKRENTCLEKYGVDHWSKTDAGNVQSAKKMTECNNIMHHCIYCDLDIKGPNYHRWHDDNCKENPNNMKSRKLDRFECEFCHKMHTKQILSQNHGKYCKENPNRIDKPKPKKREKQKCVFCNSMIDSANYKRHVKKCSST